MHPLCNRILMTAAERRKDQCARVRLAVVNVHSCNALIHLDEFRHVRKIKFGVYAQCKHVHRQSNYVNISGAFAVAKERAFNSIRARQKSQLTIRHAATSVVVRVQAQNNFVAELEIFTYVGDLRGVNVRQTHFNSDGNIYNRFAVNDRLPHVQNRVTNFQRIFRLGARETFGRIFKAIIRARLFRQLKQKFCSVDCNIFYFVFGHSKDLLALCHRSRIVNVDDCIFRAVQCLKSFLYDMFPRLRQDLNRHVVGNQIIFYQLAKECIFGIAGGGEAHFYFLESDFDERFIKFNFLVQTHRDYQRLIAVAQINTTPYRSLLRIFFLRPIHYHFGRQMITFTVLCIIFQTQHLFLTLSYYIRNVPHCKALQTGNFRL